MVEPESRLDGFGFLASVVAESVTPVSDEPPSDSHPTSNITAAISAAQPIPTVDLKFFTTTLICLVIVGYRRLPNFNLTPLVNAQLRVQPSLARAESSFPRGPRSGLATP